VPARTPAQTPARTDSAGEGGESQGSPTGGGECYYFLSENRAGLLTMVNQRFSWQKLHDHRRIEKRGFFKSLSSFSETIT